jgi:hypothetical protein
MATARAPEARTNELARRMRRAFPDGLSISGGAWVQVQKMLQCVVQRRGMRSIVAAEGSTYVVDDHRMNLLDASRVVYQIVSQCRRSDVWNVFVFGNGFDLVFVEIAHADDVVFRNHGASPAGIFVTREFTMISTSNLDVSQY